jgi:hypothetical protein
MEEPTSSKLSFNGVTTPLALFELVPDMPEFILEMVGAVILFPNASNLGRSGKLFWRVLRRSVREAVRVLFAIKRLRAAVYS